MNPAEPATGAIGVFGPIDIAGDADAGLGIWPVRAEAQALAGRLQSQLGGVIHRPWQKASRSQKEQFAAAWPKHARWLFVGATGIAVRFLEGLPQDKRSDPALVVVDEAGRFAIALLGGHEGGANRLAYQAAQAIGATPVVTTATEACKPLVIGLGCRKDVAVERIAAAVNGALALLPGRTLDEVREIATVDLKASEPGLLAFCAQHDIALRVFSHASIEARAWVGKASDWVRQNVGLEGVCEPCALLAAPRGVLALPKTAFGGIAIAIVDDAMREAIDFSPIPRPAVAGADDH